MFLLLINSRGELCTVDIQNLIYLQIDGAEGLRFYGFDCKFRALTTIRDWAILLQDHNFMQLDRGTVVNVEKIMRYISDLRVVTVHTSEGEVLLPVAEKVIRPLRKLLRKT